jgi:peptidyl-prolyl cis-trans isomerase B (cyclophilin B)
VEGMAVVDKIASVQTGRGDKPIENVYMTIQVESLPAKKIAERYPDIYSGH